MRGLWAVLGAALLCACAQANKNSIDLGRLQVHAEIGKMDPVYPPTDDDTTASENARVTLERLRPYFPTGLGHIPKMDPYYHIDPIVVKIDRSDFNCEVTVTDIVVAGAQQFVLDDAEVHLNTRRVDFDLQFPELKVSLNYQVRLKSDEAVAEFGAKADMTFQRVAVSVAYQMVVLLADLPPLDTHYKIDAMMFNATAEDIQYDLMNMARSRRSVPASEMTQFIAKEVKEEVALAIANAMMKDLQALLFNYTVDQIMKLLLPLK